MKKIAPLFLLILLALYPTGCSKNNNTEDTNNEGNVTDTISTNKDSLSNETSDTTSTNPENPGGEVSDSTDHDAGSTDTITDPDNEGGNNDTILTAVNRKDTITLTFQYGEDGPSSDWKNIYVVWLEAPGFIQNMYICNKLIAGGLTNTALPYWKMNKYPLSSSDEIDAVTAATKANCDFSLTAVLKDSTIKNLTVNFETDRSFDPNDWFDNQPALLYQASLDLEDTTTESELLPVGWTPNEDTENQVENTPMGQLQQEMKYITNYKDGSGFGEKDSRGATKMVKKITISVK